MGRLDGKVAIITGGARGQGAEEAGLFAAEGAKVVIGDVLDDEGAALATDLGDDVVFTHLDVTDEDAWREAVAFAEDRFGPVSVLVNNAGILHFQSIENTEVADLERLLRVNVIGTFLGLKTVPASMRRAGGGAIVNISSIAGLTGQPFLGAYVATKWAVRGLTKTAALELGSDGIRVNSVHPGGIATDMLAGIDEEAPFYQRLPIPRIGQVGDVAPVVLFLASDDCGYVTGAEVAVDGGSTAGDNGLLDM